MGEGEDGRCQLVNYFSVEVGDTQLFTGSRISLPSLSFRTNTPSWD